MKRFQFLASFLFLAATLTLSACGGGSGSSKSSGGYTKSSPWNYDAPARSAQSIPSALDVPQSQLRPENTGIEQEPVSPQSPAQAPSYVSNPSADIAPVKVGILLPLSGKNAALGQSLLNAAQMALFEVGHNAFELIPRDTKDSAADAQIAAREVLADGAQLVLGPVFADSVRAAKSVTSAAGVNMIAFSTDWSLADNRTYMMGFLPFDQVQRISAYAASNGIRNVAVLSPSDNYGDAVLGAYNAVSYKYGLNTVDVKRFASSASPDSVVRSLSPQTPLQGIFMPVGGQMAGRISALATQNGMAPDQVKRLGTGLWDDASLANDPSMNGAWFAAPSPSLRKGFERRYFEIYGETAPRLATLSYDATALAAVLARNGLQNGGTRPAFDASSIQNSNGFAGIDGIFRFREDGLVERGLAILEYRNGQIRIVDDAPRTFQQQGM